MDATIAYQAIRIVPVDTNEYQSSPLSSPSFPYNPYYPPIIPLTPPSNK
nr:MAG TPA: hypothetical protein [Caudoviricetes sp.]